MAGAVLLAAAGAAPAVAQDAPAGRWEGEIDVVGQQLDLAVTVRAEPQLAAWIDIQGARLLEAQEVTWSPPRLRFELDAGSNVASWDGERQGDTIRGRFTQGTAEGTFRLVRTGDVPALMAPRLSVEPDSLELTVGKQAKLAVRLTDPSSGEELESRVFFAPDRRQALAVSDDGTVRASEGGEFEIRIFAQTEDGRVARGSVPVRARWPEATGVVLRGLPERLESGNAYRVEPRILYAGGLERGGAPISLRSSDPSVLSVEPSGALRAHRSGRATLTAEGEGAGGEWRVVVTESPVRSVEVRVERRRARTGDVVQVRATARGADGREISESPIAFAVQPFPTDTLIAPPASAHVEPDGAFVAEKPGVYVVVASSGGVSGSTEVVVEARQVGEEVEVLGHGAVGHVHTSDLWVWEAADGRDYAITGTWGGDGKAYFWDVTDPTGIAPVDSVQVDARTVNDVKVSDDGRIAVISREGASNRRNGIVILDVTDPRDVRILSEFDDGLTGGVHNVFVHRGHVYAVNNGRRYDIIDIRDPRNPTRVGRFELETPGHAVHDVWVVDGIAYSSNWRDGVWLVDVGNGVAGGSPSNPVPIGHYAYPSGANHAAFPWRSESTGRFYVIAGDEIMPGFDPDRPGRTKGYIHFIDFTDPDSPREVARYQVPEAGTHNLWVEGDRLYVAYYEGGLRVVDISGELRGDLYRQGREIARFKAYDPEGRVPNAPMAWGPQPHKGVVFFSDFNSGLWAVRLRASRPLVP